MAKTTETTLKGAESLALIDGFGRKIDYLRLSITDKCNLKCLYCMPPFSGRPHLAQTEILNYEELYRLAEAAVTTGVSKIRVTGGEPLVRKGVIGFCEMLGKLRGLTDLSLTTNGIHLAAMAAPLRKAGVNRINISLDTLRPDTFADIAGRSRFDAVWTGIRQAEAVGFSPIKINVVVMRGVNDQEIDKMAAMTYAHPWHVRFIELMPFKTSTHDAYRQLYLPVGAIMKKIPHIEAAQLVPADATNGPARLCTLPGAKGKIGFIAPLSWHFCSTCNRLRVTADGNIRPCLFSEKEIDVKDPLRSGATRAELAALIQQASKTKPQGHFQEPYQARAHPWRTMRAIGG